MYVQNTAGRDWLLFICIEDNVHRFGKWITNKCINHSTELSPEEIDGCGPYFISYLLFFCRKIMNDYFSKIQSIRKSIFSTIVIEIFNSSSSDKILNVIQTRWKKGNFPIPVRFVTGVKYPYLKPLLNVHNLNVTFSSSTQKLREFNKTTMR